MCTYAMHAKKTPQNSFYLLNTIRRQSDSFKILHTSLPNLQEKKFHFPKLAAKLNFSKNANHKIAFIYKIINYSLGKLFLYQQSSKQIFFVHKAHNIFVFQVKTIALSCHLSSGSLYNVIVFVQENLCLSRLGQCFWWCIIHLWLLMEYVLQWL